MNYQMPEAECLNESNSVLFKRGDVSSLTGAIKKGLLLKDPLETEDKCRNTILKTYTSKNQAQIIKTFLCLISKDAITVDVVLPKPISSARINLSLETNFLMASFWCSNGGRWVYFE